MAYQHTPVMLKEVIEYLEPQPGQKFIDCTLGGGGYTLEMAKKILPAGKILAIDLDIMAIDNLKFRILNLKLQNIILAKDNFKNLQAIVKKYFTKETKFDGIVFDLGLSSAQLEDSSRGFSFKLMGSPLKMNFGEAGEETAEDLINDRSLEELTAIFKDYGEERFAYRIALAITRQRLIKRIATTDQLVKIITATVPKRNQQSKIHPATRIFQALRLAVNRELENLSLALPQAVDLLKTGGRLAVISYQSLEDRLVKQYFKKAAQGCLCPPAMPLCRCGHQAELKILTKKVLRPGKEEVLRNSRARSAKLRVAEKI